MWADELKQARFSAIATVGAFLVGLVLASIVKCQPPGPTPAPAIMRPAPASPAPESSPPAVTATAGAKTRVVIERPALPVQQMTPASVVQENGPGTNFPDPHLAPGAAGLLNQGLGIERIIIETEGTGTASAPVPTPPPPGIVEVDRGPGAFGVMVGTMPGVLALDYQFMRGELLGHTLGASVIGNGQMLGAGGGISLPGIDQRLYLGAGAYQEYKLIPDPGLYIGAGWRF